MKQDYNGVRTAQDLERKYDFSSLEKVDEINNNLIQANKNILINNMNNELKLFVEAVTKYMEDYSVDGNITTYYFSGVPSLNNNPAVEWTTDEEKTNHIWDLYYDRETGYVYMFTYDNETYSWERLEDYDVEKALALANAYTDTKDNKRRLFLEQPTPPYDNGDMWYNNGEIYVCQIAKPEGETFENADFIICSKYVDNTVATKADNKFTVISGSVLEIENNVNSYSRTLTETVKVVDEHGNYIGDRSQKTTSLTQDVDGIELNIGVMDSSQGTLSQQTAQLRADVSEIRGEIGDVTDVTITKEDIGVLYFDADDENINESSPISMLIYPTAEDLSQVYPGQSTYPTTQDYPAKAGLKPSSTLTPSSTLVPSTGYPAQKIKYPTVMYIDFYNETENEHIYYPFPKDLRIVGTTYDEYQYDYENLSCKVIRRIGVNSYGEKYILQTPIEETITFPDIRLTTGKYTVTFVPFNTAYMKMRLMSQNMYTSQFATKVEMNNRFEITQNDINLVSSQKITGFDENGVRTDDVFSSINLAPGTATITANKINIAGVITAINNNTTTTIDGNKITTGTLSANQITSGTLNGNLVNVANVNASNITSGTLNSSVIGANSITADKVSSDIITTSNFSAQNINADKITSGTLDASQVNVANINADNITSGTISANKLSGGTITGSAVNLGSNKFKLLTNGSLQYYDSPGFLYCGGNTTNHPYVSALNVATQGSNLGGISFRNSDSRADAGKEKARLAYGGDYDQLLLRTATGNMNISIGKNMRTDTAGYYTVSAGNSNAPNEYSGSMYLYAQESISLNAKNGHVYAGAGGTSNARVATDSSGPSSRCLKENIKDFKNQDYQDALSLLKDIKIYTYDYKYNIAENNNQYGFIIDDLLNDKNAQKFLYFKDDKAVIRGKDLDYQLAEEEPDNKNILNFKRYDETMLVKYLLITNKALLGKIEELESRIK